MSITSTFAPSTWRILGLSVATSYAALGTVAFIAPKFTSHVFGLSLGTGPVENDSVARSFKLVAARDVSIAAALFAFSARDQPQAMGVLILSTMILCEWDVYECARNVGFAEASLMGSVAAVWGIIGLGLLNMKSY